MRTAVLYQSALEATNCWNSAGLYIRVFLFFSRSAAAGGQQDSPSCRRQPDRKPSSSPDRAKERGNRQPRDILVESYQPDQLLASMAVDDDGLDKNIPRRHSVRESYAAAASSAAVASTAYSAAAAASSDAAGWKEKTPSSSSKETTPSECCISRSRNRLATPTTFKYAPQYLSQSRVNGDQLFLCAPPPYGTRPVQNKSHLKIRWFIW